jgi:hypothetical protein
VRKAPARPPDSQGAMIVNQCHACFIYSLSPTVHSPNNIVVDGRDLPPAVPIANEDNIAF